jgi:hypothetical protein
MSVKKAKNQNVFVKLAAVLKCSVDDARVLAKLERELLTLKANKESSKCKVKRQQMRNKKFFRHEHEASTIALLQSASKLIS